MAGKSYKYVTLKTTIGDAVSDACSELSELASELSDWASGMEGTGLENTEKYSTVREAADTLENVSEPDVPKEISDVEISFTQAQNKNKRAGPSRMVRLENACNLLAAVVDHLESLDNEDSDEESEDYSDLATEVGQVRDEVEGVEIPGMFG